MSAPSYVLGGPCGLATQRDEVMLGDVVGVVTYVDTLAGELDAQAVAQTEDVGVEGADWRRRWRVGAVVGGREAVGWGRGRAQAVEALRQRVAVLGLSSVRTGAIAEEAGAA